MKILTCPDLETLEYFLLGKLPAEQSNQLDEHLISCENCAAQLDAASASDEFTAALKLKQEIQSNEHLKQAIEQSKQLISETDTVETEETAVVDRRSQTHEPDPSVEVATEKKRPEPQVDFLRPAEQPDEIGRLGDYRVLEILGVGGMGIVFRAEDIKLKREVALKAMKPAIAALDSAKQRFIREAQATAAFDHDHIVQIYQVGEDQGVPFIAMQFLKGESLESKLKREKKLDELEVATIGKQIALGLAAAHQRNLVHRDIKPDNIWLDEKTGRAKILDFGLVRTVNDEDSGLTQSGMVIGTPKYMAPEQAKGEKVDARCDLFSLGSVLYHLSTGKPAFQGKNMTATLMAVSYHDAKPIEERNPELNSQLAGVITHLLAKDPDQRMRPAEEVADNWAKSKNDSNNKSSQQPNLIKPSRLRELPHSLSPLHAPPSSWAGQSLPLHWVCSFSSGSSASSSPSKPKMAPFISLSMTRPK
ncbi:MAG: serine/threonine-protein kinase [Pirellulales bacterium]